MITIIAILRDISSAVENYFQKILRTPHEKIQSPIFTQSPLNIEKVQASPFANIENFSGPPTERGRENTRVHVSVVRKTAIDLSYF